MTDYMAQMQGLKALAIKQGLDLNGAIEGCSEAEIEALEQKYACTLPASYRAYLLVMGKNPPKLFDVDTYYSYEDILLQDEEKDAYPYPFMFESATYSKLADKVLFFVIGSINFSFLFYRYTSDDDPMVYMVNDEHNFNHTVPYYIPKTIGHSFCQALELQLEGQIKSSNRNYSYLATRAEELWTRLNFTIPDWAKLNDCYDWENVQNLDELKPKSVSPFEMEEQQDLALNILCLSPYRLLRCLQKPDTVGLNLYDCYRSPLQVRVRGQLVYNVDSQQYLSLAMLMYQWIQAAGPKNHLSFVYARDNCCLSEAQLHVSNINELNNTHQTVNPIVFIYEELYQGWRMYLPTYIHAPTNKYMSPEVFSAETLTACFQNFIDFVDKLLAWNFRQRPAITVEHLSTQNYPTWVRLPRT